MKLLIITLIFLALPWKVVGAQLTPQMLQDSADYQNSFWRLDSQIKPNKKYRVIWHEFVPLIANCHCEQYPNDRTSYSMDTLELERYEDTAKCQPLYELWVDRLWVDVKKYRYNCDTVGFRPTVIEYREIADTVRVVRVK